ncbi:MAG: SMC-Scp complex subunit ScpB [Kiritimatiellales bacterium]
MSNIEVLPELKQIIGSLLFAAKKPLTSKELRKVLADAGSSYGGPYEQFAGIKEDEIIAALGELTSELAHGSSGLCIAEVAHGYRLQNEINCGPWVRTLLDKDKNARLSKPALETLAIIAYRQPILRSEIESVRGVAVDQVLRNLVEMQLVKVVARSDLPGRPWLFGTTQRFLEHFGLRSLDEMPGMEELKRMEKPERTKTFPAMEKELEESLNNQAPNDEGDSNDEISEPE